jgi:hypothetical protein
MVNLIKLRCGGPGFWDCEYRRNFDLKARHNIAKLTVRPPKVTHAIPPHSERHKVASSSIAAMWDVISASLLTLGSARLIANSARPWVSIFGPFDAKAPFKQRYRHREQEAQSGSDDAGEVLPWESDPRPVEYKSACRLISWMLEVRLLLCPRVQKQFLG